MAKELRELTYDQLVELYSEVSAEIKRRAIREWSKKMKEDVALITKETQQEKRDRIVEQAKKDVAKLFGDRRLRRRTKFEVNREKRTIVALIYSFETYPAKVDKRGIAKCAPGDCFNVHIGKAIALRRALGLEVPDEYTNAPQPTEVRLGYVVGYPFDPEDNEYDEVREANDVYMYYKDGGRDRIEYLFEDDDDITMRLRIIDDSREGVTR